MQVCSIGKEANWGREMAFDKAVNNGSLEVSPFLSKGLIGKVLLGWEGGKQGRQVNSSYFIPCLLPVLLLLHLVCRFCLFCLSVYYRILVRSKSITALALACPSFFSYSSSHNGLQLLLPLKTLSVWHQGPDQDCQIDPQIPHNDDRCLYLVWTSCRGNPESKQLNGMFTGCKTLPALFMGRSIDRSIHWLNKFEIAKFKITSWQQTVAPIFWQYLFMLQLLAAWSSLAPKICVDKQYFMALSLAYWQLWIDFE